MTSIRRRQQIDSIRDRVLDESCSPGELRDALDAFSQLCEDAGGVRPDRSFDAWAGDTLLDNGVAINPRAAAHCVTDYQRTVAFLRGVNAAIDTLKIRFAQRPLEVLYAGCGPFATLLLPLLGRFAPGELNITLLDIHHHSLDSVELLLTQVGFPDHAVHTVQGDACHYKHPGLLHLVIAETMQKALEQEPQFAVTANLAPQLQPAGVFIPQRIEVAMCLADLALEKARAGQSRQSAHGDLESKTGRYPLATVCTLSPHNAPAQVETARRNADTTKLELEPVAVVIPALAELARLQVALFTRIDIFEHFRLRDYESQITLPLNCHELLPLAAGERYQVCYQLGSYPKFRFEQLPVE